MYKGAWQDDATDFLRIDIFCYVFLQSYSIISRCSPVPRTTLSQEISKNARGDTELIVLKETSKTLFSDHFSLVMFISV